MTSIATHRDPWQQELVSALRDPAQLLRELQLPQSLLDGAHAGSKSFQLLVTRSFLARMRVGDANDPLLRQILPTKAELESTAGFNADPLQEAAARRAPGLVQKYGSRALLIAAGSCAINCRYCFRREYPYDTEPRQLKDWEPALNEIRANTDINEIILSGGDPLVLNDDRLDALLSQLESIPHLKMLRVHSRLPIVLPSRLTRRLVERLLESRLQPVVVVHSNHPNEIESDCREALSNLVRSGVPTLNQTVLLRNINDDSNTLVQLSQRLIGIGVMPYYLHLLDHVSGTAHFEVERERGKQIIAEMRCELPGYAVPRFVVEEPGLPHKTVIA